METQKSNRLSGKIKRCKICNKEMAKKEYPFYFGTRKYCSNECKKKVRIDGKKSKKRILIIGIPKKLEVLFDEIYFFNSKKSLDELNECLKNKEMKGGII